MKKIILIISILLSACAPSANSIQTAIVETQSSWTMTPVPTEKATSTSTATIVPTPTPTRPPTATTEPKTVYLLEIGLCLEFNQDFASNTGSAGCLAAEKNRVTFTERQRSITTSIPELDGVVYPYCILYNPLGEVVAQSIAEDNATSVTCTIASTITETPGIATSTPATLKDAKNNGFHLVNVEIAPGVWLSHGKQNDCYWATTTKSGDIINNHFGMAGGTAYIAPNAFQVEFNGCGVWTYVGPP